MTLSLVFGYRSRDLDCVAPPSLLLFRIRERLQSQNSCIY
jgi:hypothetical protein